MFDINFTFRVLIYACTMPKRKTAFLLGLRVSTINNKCCIRQSVYTTRHIISLFRR